MPPTVSIPPSGSATVSVDGKEVRLTNLDKVLAPGRDGEPPLTKRDLIRYHAEAAPLMVPHLVDRPVNLHRFPDGVEAGDLDTGLWMSRLVRRFGGSG